MNNIDWDLVKIFLSVSEHGSLSSAARDLSLSQPTLSRKIQQLETESQLNLFKRTTQGLRLTEAGHALLDSAKQMHNAADLFNRQASGLSEELSGVVRISASEIIGQYTLAPAITAFRQEHPAVQIEIVISNKASSLNKREADIALRMFRPSQPDLVAHRLPNMSLGFYAHRDYLAQFGTPQSFDSFNEHTIIGFDQDRSFIEGAAAMGIQLKPEDFSIRTDHILTQLSLVRSAAGITVTYVKLAEQYPELQQILYDVPLEPLQLWCVCHGDVQFNSRIRALMNFLVDWYSTNPFRNILI